MRKTSWESGKATRLRYRSDPSEGEREGRWMEVSSIAMWVYWKFRKAPQVSPTNRPVLVCLLCLATGWEKPRKNGFSLHGMINGFQRSSWGHCSITFLVFGDLIVHSHGVKSDKTDSGDPLASMISILLYLANLTLSTLLSLCSSHLVSILFPSPTFKSLLKCHLPCQRHLPWLPYIKLPPVCFSNPH